MSDEAKVAVVQELWMLRKHYDDLEMRHVTDLEQKPIATWQGYKFFRNPISDRIELMTGVRSDQEIQDWLDKMKSTA